MTRKKRRKKKLLACFALTPATAHVTSEALALFEQSLQHADHQKPETEFAEGTMKRVKDKLDTLKRSPGSIVNFDYNEKVILIYALHMYGSDLLFLPPNDQRTKKVQQCQRIAAYFEAENARAERNHPKRGKAADIHFLTDG